jgi:hypothetical protein
MTSNTVDPSASMFTSLLADDCPIANSALLSNDLQQWGLLHQGKCLTTASNLDWPVYLQTLSRPNQLACPTGPRDITSGQSNRKHLFLKLLYCSHAAAGLDHTENTASDSSSIVAQVTFAMLTQHVVFHCCITLYYAVTNNGRLFQLDYAGFQWTCHDMFYCDLQIVRNLFTDAVMHLIQ